MESRLNGSYYSNVSHMYCVAPGDPHEWTWLTNRTNHCNGVYDACHDICYEGYDDMYRLNNRWPLKYAIPIYAIAFPILLAFLVISNVFIVLVMSKKHMTSPTNTVLLYMAIADMFVGLVPAPFTLFYFTLGYYKYEHLHEEWWCYMGHYLMDVLPPLCHNVAIWLTVLLAAQRFMYIQYPVRAQKHCTIANVRWACVIIVIVSLLSVILKFFEVSFVLFRGYNATFDPNTNRTRVEDSAGSSFCLSRLTPLVDFMTPDIYYPIYVWPRALGFVVLPSAILVVLNLLLINGLRKAQERRNRLLFENRSREANRQKESNNTSLMLVLVVSIFLLVNLPQAMFFIVLCVDTAMHLDIAFFRSDYANLFVMVDNMLIMATYPLNFAIYCSTSTQFRDTFRRIFCDTLPIKDRRSSTMTYYSYLIINEDGVSKVAQEAPTQNNDTNDCTV